MLEGKARVVCTCRDSTQVTLVLPHHQNYYLALLQLSVSLNLSSSCVKDDPYKDQVSLCRS